MTAKSDLTSGTITLTNGSVDFVGTGTSFAIDAVQEGDEFLQIAGQTQWQAMVATIVDNTHGTLVRPWGGATGTYAYRLRYQNDGARMGAQARNLIELLGDGTLLSLAGLTGPGVIELLPGGGAQVVSRTDLVSGAAYDVQVANLSARAAYDGQAAGYAVLVANVGDGRSAIYSKASNASADWSAPAYLTGPVGPNPTITVDTTTTLPPGSAATVVATPVLGGVELDFGIPAGEGFVSRGAYSGATAYVKGDVVMNNSSSWIAKVSTTGNAPPNLPTTSNTQWQLLAAKGTDGTGTGDIVGPGVSIDGQIAAASGPTGKLLKYLTAAQATATLNAVAGDSGAGGTKGLVPAPAAGDAAASKFLKADGTWAAAASNASFGIVAAIGASKGMGTRLFLPNALADGFRGADGVGVTSSNYLQDTAVGRVYPSIATTMIPQATGTNIGNATDIGGLAASFDGVTAQTSAVVSRGTATGVAAYVGKNYSAAPKKIVSATVYASSNLGFDSSNSAATYEVRLYGKNGSAPANSTDGTLLATVTGADAAAAVANLTSSDSATAFDYVWVRVSTNLSGEFYYIAEAQFYTPSIANMTLITAAALIDIIPASIKACLILRPFEAMTLNTDLTLRLSRDGGTTWSSATLVQVNTLGTDRYLETAKIVVSGQPSGSSIVAEIKTLNNKSCEIRGFEFEAF